MPIKRKRASGVFNIRKPPDFANFHKITIANGWSGSTGSIFWANLAAVFSRSSAHKRE
ncbi:hypothetical protein GCM10023228_00060 [Brevibacillus fulvus]